jgi:hypothetical protein
VAATRAALRFLRLPVLGKAFNPNQQRGEDGRFGAGSGGGNKRPARGPRTPAPIPPAADIQLMSDVLRAWNGGRVNLTPEQWERAEALFDRLGGGA